MACAAPTWLLAYAKALPLNCSGKTGVCSKVLQTCVKLSKRTAAPAFKASSAAFAKLKAVLTQLRPEAGFLDDGDGSGRHAANVKKGKKEPDEQ